MPEILVPVASDYSPERVRRLYKLLKGQYLRLMSTVESRLRYCPPKTMLVIRTWGEVDPQAAEPNASDARATTLPAMLPGLCVGGKFIVADETSRERAAVTTVYDEHLHLLGVVDAGFLTELRCALMAALAVDLCYPGITPEDRVGLVGTGSVNLRTAWVFHHLFGSTQFVWRGSARQRDRNLAEVQALAPAAQFVVDHKQPAELLRDCGVVVTCTTNGILAEAVTYDEAPAARVYVSQDTGWGLGPTIREHTVCYADHPEQLNRNLASHFPWDHTLPNLQPLAEAAIPGSPAATEAQVGVYLHGIGLADLAVAYEALVNRS